MTNSNTNFKTFMLNLFDFLTFGFNLFRKGTCDKRIKEDYKLTESSESKGYTKIEASKKLNISVRQFDRRIKQGLIPKGHKYQKDSKLYWDKEYIDKLSNTL